MADPREAIMVRLVEVIDGVLDASDVSRNQLYGDDAKPAPRTVSVLEGDETSAAGEEGINRVPGAAGGLVNMHPQVLLLNFNSADVVGAGLNEARALIIKAVTSDSQLKALTHRGFGGRYTGMESDLAMARDALGRMALKFQFTYSLVPSEL